MKPLISIIVPAYNIEKYLKRSINSILNQTYTNIEIIIINDGSSDQTGQIAEELKRSAPSRIICIHQPNSGVTLARINGIKAAHGEWIGFVDGDDEIENTMYARLLRNALETRADISHCGYQTIVNNGERIHYFYNTGKKYVFNNLQGKKALLLGNQIEPGIWNKLYKKELLDKMLEKGRLDYSIKYTEDLLMNYILFDYAEVSVYEDFCPYHYMAHNSSATRSVFNVKKALDPIAVRKYILENCDDELKFLSWRKYIVSSCVAYQSICNKKTYEQEAKVIKRDMIKNFSKIKFLTNKEKIKFYLIIFTPHSYSACYSFYAKHFQKKIYE